MYFGQPFGHLTVPVTNWRLGRLFYEAPRHLHVNGPTRPVIDMKIKNSLKALKARHRDCQLVRRKGRVYIINKTAPRYKARQG